VAPIGEYNQTELHEQLKHWYAAEASDVPALEVEVDGYVIDVVRDGELLEIQTRSLGKLRKKITELSTAHAVRLVHPVAATTVIEKRSPDGALISRRRSPRRGRVEHAFRELVSLASLLPHEHITLEIVLVDVTEERVDDGRGSWRRKGVRIAGRRLDRVLSRHEFRTRADYAALLPDSIGEEFSNADLVEALGLPYRVVQPITSCLRKMGVLTVEGVRTSERGGRIHVYARSSF
jgi:hypothetical protein